MLEKIGLPAKPSLRGNVWVVDASHCQGCSSQFSFINRKHHCRRCGGLFCGSCTQQRMSLRGQGDAPVRICDPCKKLEEAARFELRQGYKSRASKGGSKKIVKSEDDVLSEILGSDVDVSSSAESVASGSSSNKDMELDGVSVSPEEMRRQAVEEKNKYKVLKGEGKSEEALKAFKRGKELERQADALEISLRKEKRAMSMRSVVVETQNKVARKESSQSQKPPRHDDLASELRELGWSDDEEKKPANVSLEGEFSSLLREIPVKSNSLKKSGGIDKSQVIAMKKKALALKREGKLPEAREELKRAKILERELEEQELLGGDDESDDEISALIRSMDDDDKEDDLLAQYEGSHDFDISSLVGTVDDIGLHGEYDVTDEDMDDPAIAAALKSMGWTEEPQSSSNTREECLAEIQTLKREALKLKRDGNVAEAMATLKKAKLLERELESADTSDTIMEEKKISTKVPPRSRLVIQRELLAVKKKALTLKREGKFNEAEEELKKGAVLQEQLDELDNSSKVAAAGKENREKRDLGNDLPDISTDSMDVDGEVDVKDDELNDPSYLSMLKNLGWNDEDNNPAGSSQAKPAPASSKPVDAYETRVTKRRRSKAEIQRELLGLKRKALTLRRQGNVDEADEVLNQTKILEAEMMEIDSATNLHAHGSDHLNKTSTDSGINKVDESVTENDMKEDKPKALAINSTSYMDVDLLVGGSQRDDKAVKSDSVSHAAQGNYDLLGDFISPAKSGSISAQSVKQQPSMVDLLTGDYSERSQIPAEKRKVETKTEHVFGAEQTVAREESNPVNVQSTSVQNTSPQKQEILAYKRKALAFKKEGKMSEAKEALLQAKLLERKLQEGENSSPENIKRDDTFSVTHPPHATVSVTHPPPAREKENSPSSSASKPMSSRDRFKLQQESLSHKRQAMKLRREGKMEEAEAELEIAKTLEAQLEDATSSSKPEAIDNVAVESFLDPQLLSALKAIGLDSSVQSSVVTQPAAKLVQPNPEKESNDSNQERSQLEERIKAEKIKAVTLKRAGKQAEALDALRRAKLYEKKLNALASN